MDKDYSNSIAVVWPTNWPIDEPESHCTIIFLGDKREVEFTSLDLWDALSRIKWPMLTVPTNGTTMFGPEEDIPVVLLDSVMLHTLHDRYVEILSGMGIESASEFTEYRPHITVSKVPAIIPQYVNLGSPRVWWGDDGKS